MLTLIPTTSLVNQLYYTYILNVLQVWIWNLCYLYIYIYIYQDVIFLLQVQPLTVDLDDEPIIDVEQACPILLTT